MSRPTVLVMTRGLRLHALERDMVTDLSRDHRVVVLALPACADDYRAIPGVDVRLYETPDVGGALERRFSGDDRALSEQAQALERTLGLPVFKAAGNYLLYGRVVREFGGHWEYLETERDILEAYVLAGTFLTRLFDEIRPAAVFYEAVDLISNIVALAIAVQRGIFAFDLRPSPLGEGKGGLGFGLERRNIMLDYLFEHVEHIEPRWYDEARALLRDPRPHLYESAWTRAHRSMVGAQSPIRLERLATALRAPGRMRNGLANARWHARTLRNTRWLERHLHREPPPGRYVAFMLSHMPEASTCSQAPRWVNADAIVEQLAVNAPAGLRILVKEHPRTYGRRGAAFFEKLERLPSVWLCHPSVDNSTMLSGAEAVLTITGSAGFEGLVLGRRVGVLGRPFYSKFPGVRPLNAPEEIFDAIADPAFRPETMTAERERFLAAYLQSLFDFGAGVGASVHGRRSGRGWAEALRGTLAFVTAHGLEPADLRGAIRVRRTR